MYGTEEFAESEEDSFYGQGEFGLVPHRNLQVRAVA
jgi:hypothetical protein